MQSEFQPFKLSYYLQSGENASAHLMSAVKRTMYEQAPGEGAWMQCFIVVQSSSSWTIDFNYDEVESLPENKKSPDYLLLEFQKFPRSKQFTPSWWKTIVHNKVSYYK
ncbi:MAG: hypothetical protein EOP45_16980 [Sphingobacteriaceae bacterium]|nr:MAG: hypothetical protein EOP45_16980 [Sphingobacteriaceae bacterium]